MSGKLPKLSYSTVKAVYHSFAEVGESRKTFMKHFLSNKTLIYNWVFDSYTVDMLKEKGREDLLKVMHELAAYGKAL